MGVYVYFLLDETSDLNSSQCSRLLNCEKIERLKGKGLCRWDTRLEPRLGLRLGLRAGAFVNWKWYARHVSMEVLLHTCIVTYILRCVVLVHASSEMGHWESV